VWEGPEVSTYEDVSPRSRGRRPLRRSRRHRLIGGVCGGLAEWWGKDPTLVRILFVLVGALPFLSGILVYLVLWIVMPAEEQGVPPAGAPPPGR
jgi:phage shock protein C